MNKELFTSPLFHLNTRMGAHTTESLSNVFEIELVVELTKVKV